jgi:hypothetical protein
MDDRKIAAILRFSFADNEEVRAHSADGLPEELLNKLRVFAAGKLKGKELEQVSERIASNTAAIEVLAHEIKKHWSE